MTSFVINDTGTSIGVIVEPLMATQMTQASMHVGAQVLGTGGNVGCALHFSARAIPKEALETLAANPQAKAAYWLTSNSGEGTVTVLGMAYSGRPALILRKNVKRGQGLIINTVA